MEYHERNFEYSPLGDLEIRLVKLRKATAELDHIQLDLEHVQVPDAPSYVALSHTWGDPNDKIPVYINDLVFPITTNLSKALLQIRNISPDIQKNLGQVPTAEAELFLWIDAICINQEDLEEKSK